MFGIVPKDIEFISLPLWEFKVKEKEGKKTRILYIDSVSGKMVEKPFGYVLDFEIGFRW